MGDNYTEYEHTGFLGNMGNSFGNMLFGFVLFLASFVVLWWNEGRAVDRYLTLETGQKNLVKTTKFEAKNDGKLVFVTGMTDVKTPAIDADFNVQNNKALKIYRRVEMYQWDESKSTRKQKNLGGSTTKKTTYSYDKVWSTRHIDSNSFNQKYRDKYKNPSTKSPSKSYYAKGAKVKGYSLNSKQIELLDDLKNMQVPKTVKFPAKMANKAKNNGSFIFISRSGNSSISNPQVGDYKISFQYLPAQNISVIGEQSDGGFTEYTTKTGDLLEVRAGKMKAEKIFQQASSENETLTWILRGVGVLAMTFGLAMCASPLQALFNIIPFFGSMVGAITGLFALIVALALSSITIAIAWMAHRPMLSIAVGGAGIGIWMLMRLMQPKRETRIAR